MLYLRIKYLLFVFILFGAACKKPYEPAAIVARNNYLVVDGTINAGVSGVTIINLSRARNLGDSTFDILPEGSAAVNIESSAGTSYPLHQTATGTYLSDTISLSSNQTYRLNIKTANGNQYQSDFASVKRSPPIDSITWQQKDGVTVFASTHDPANNTKYYRWDFIETWQHNARYETSLGIRNNLIFYRDSTNSVYKCWSNANSTSIVLATSAALSQDVISKAPVTFLVQNDEKIAIRYSILVRQYALTAEAYQYWEIIQKNTQKIGTLFDLQPSQLHGNVHPITNKDEPVIGFVSAGSVQEKRIFISNSELTNWVVLPLVQSCPIKNIDQDPANYLLWNYPDTSYAPYYFTSPSGINITKNACLDCRLQGGSNKKPSFW